MTWFIFKRIFRSFISVFFVTLIVFVLIRVIPGDPIRTMVTGTAPDSAVEQLRKDLGLDKPIPVQFMVFFKDAIRGDLGKSFFRSKQGGVGQSVGGSAAARMEAAGKGVEGLESIAKEAHERASVSKLIFSRFPLTLLLIFCSLVIGALISFIFAFISIKNKRIASFFDVFTVFIGALPNFWLAIMFILIFSVKLNLLSGVGFSSWKSLILPCSVLILGLVPSTFKTMFESLKRINSESFMVALSERGMPEKIINRHRYRHFFSSIITFLGLQFGPLLGGVIIVEWLYSIPGMGTLFIYAVLQRDYPLIVGGVIIISILFVGLNFFVDIIYGVLDPRAREW